jgi:hypothetical protein
MTNVAIYLARMTTVITLGEVNRSAGCRASGERARPRAADVRRGLFSAGSPERAYRPAAKSASRQGGRAIQPNTSINRVVTSQPGEELEISLNAQKLGTQRLLVVGESTAPMPLSIQFTLKSPNASHEIPFVKGLQWVV